MTVELKHTLMNKITADKQTLNALASIFFEIGDVYEAQGYDILADVAREDACHIHDVLAAEGYYRLEKR